MKITATFAMISSAIFAVICLGVAISSFNSLGDISDPAQLDNARGFAWFWVFLGVVAAVFGGLSWWIGHTDRDNTGQ